MSVSVEPGSMVMIMKGATGASGYTPVVQVVNLKKMSASGTSTNDRWRLVLSDGRHFSQSMLATQQNGMIESQELQEGCLIRLTDFIVNVVHNKNLIIVLKLEVLTGPQPKMGEPTSLADDPDAERPQRQDQSSSKGNNGPYGHHAKSKTAGNNPYRQDVKPTIPNSNPYANASKQAFIPNGGGAGSNYGTGGGAYGGARNGGYMGGGGAPNPYSSRGTGSNSAPIHPQTQDSAFVPISALNPYQNRWIIKARVTNKSDIRRWSNAKGEGHLFSIDLLDESRSEIRGTFFKADADRWFDVVQVGQVYSFSGGRIKVANKNYSSLNAEYEITFDSSTAIMPIEDDSRIQSMQYSFVKLSEMESLEPNTIVDVVAIVKSYEDCSVINTRAGKEIEKRNLTLVDDTCTEITITLWGGNAKEDGARWDGSPVVAFKGVKLSDYSGRSLSTLNSSTVVPEPDVAEASDLHSWFRSNGTGSSFKTVSVRSGGGGGDDMARKDISARYTLESIRENKLGHGEKPDYAVVKATISFIKLDPEKDPWYPACPTDGCNKKVTETAENSWTCEKCNRTFPSCSRRYILSMTISDQTGRAWVTAFNDVAEPLLGGKTADSLDELRANGEDGAYEDVFTEACFQTYMVTLRIKAEMVQDEMRLKNTIQRMAPLDMKAESQALLSAIAMYQ